MLGVIASRVNIKTSKNLKVVANLFVDDPK